MSSIRPADTPPPPHQILVLSVGPDFLCHPQALAPGFPQEIGWFLSTGSVLGVGSVAGPMVHSQVSDFVLIFVFGPKFDESRISICI